MRRLVRVLRWAEPAAVALLAVLCVAGTFLGAERARAMFNSAPLAAFWVLALLWAGVRVVATGRVSGRLALLGVVLVLAGGLWGSASGRRISSRLFGRDEPIEGYMLLPDGRLCDDLFDGAFEHRVGRLPFHLALEEFRFDVDQATGGVREYSARVTVFAEGGEVPEAVIEVNRPLHWGGYHFSLQGGDSGSRAYAILRAKPDSGLWAVYAGMALLCGGAFWICWLRPVAGRLGRAHGD